MADKSTSLIVDALRCGLAAPNGLPLFAGKGGPGLFPATTAAKQAAQLCKDQGLLQVLRTETRGKSSLETCAVSEKGLSYLLRQEHPKAVLEQLVTGLQERSGQLDGVIDAARQSQAILDRLRTFTEKVLEEVRKSALPTLQADLCADILNVLTEWQRAGNLDDCALPELYWQLKRSAPKLAVGAFHDALRRLHDEHRLLLHPWTGPLYDLPEPGFALLIGHEIAYYVSVPVAEGRTPCQLSETWSSGR